MTLLKFGWLVAIAVVACGDSVVGRLPLEFENNFRPNTATFGACFVNAGLGLRISSGRTASSASLCASSQKLQRPSPLSVAMSEMPWEPSAKPENNVGYSGRGEAVRSLALEAREGAKFLGDLPRQRVFVTATIECPEAVVEQAQSQHVPKPSYTMPSDDAVDEVKQSLEIRAKLHKMMHQDVIDAYTGQQDSGDVQEPAKLHLKFGNANGFFRRWPKQQYTVTLSQVGNNAFEVTPESSAEAMSDMGIVSLRAQYISGERMLKVSGFMDGADIDGELRAVPMSRTPDNQHVY